jgi:hypothetical protein
VLNSLAEVLIAAADLLEAEGRTLRRAFLRTVWGVALIGFAGLLAVAGAALCTWALYQYLALPLAQSTAALLTGLIVLAVAGLLAWIVRRANE